MSTYELTVVDKCGFIRTIEVQAWDLEDAFAQYYANRKEHGSQGLVDVLEVSQRV